MSAYYASISLSNSTVSDNLAFFNAGGVYAPSSSINLSNSIVANSPRGGDCYVRTSTITSDSVSIIEDGTCSATSIGARTGDPGLFPLANNGGPTLTHAIKADSIVRDSAISANCEATDQRGRPRPNGACDVGSFELATLQVTTLADETSDNGQCSLREAIDSVDTGLLANDCSVPDGNGLVPPPSIIFANNLDNGTITLSHGQFEIDNSVTIDASTLSGGITVNGNNTSRAFYVNSATLMIDSMTITGGSAGSNGGGMLVTNFSTVSLSNSTVLGNSASHLGGGVMTIFSSSASLSNSRVSDNSAEQGGGVMAMFSSSASLSNSTVSGNSAPLSLGGGVLAYQSSASLSNSTVSGNSALVGGGVSASDSNMTLSNSTVSGNSASVGGGVYAGASSSVSLSNSTVSGNSAFTGGGVYALNSSVSLDNSIVANSLGDADCNLYTSTVTSDSVSIIQDGGCSTSARTGDPGILPLMNNGGPTKTHALRTNSPARNTGILGTCTETDQRGRIRDDGDGACDVGAIEFDPNDDMAFIVIPLGNGKVAVIPN